jgi:uncharacterized repeat protein (TIGR01451 family)
MMPRQFGKQVTTSVAAMLLGLLSSSLFAAPGDILFSDDFNRPNLAPWTTTNTARSGILSGGQTSGSNPRAGFTRNNAVTVTSPTFNAAVPAARFDIWVRRGSDALPNSEDTDAGEDFVIEYRTAGGAWNPIVTYLGSGTNGQIYQASFVLPGAALHTALALRVRQTFGSGVDFDYWHFDDVVVTEIAPGSPLSVGSCDEFENGLAANWTVNSSGGLAGISAATFLSPNNSLFLNGGVVNVTSNAIDTTDITFSDLSLWIRRGSDAFSEDPDFGENLVVEYFDNSGSWVALETFSGAGGPGQIFNRSYPIPATGRHTGFRIRLRMTGGSGVVWDFWHIDSVCLDQDPDPILQVTKTVTTLSDPINGMSSPNPIPGAIVEYTITVVNQGVGPADADSLIITDPLPLNTALFVSTLSGDPITFSNGSPPSGLSYDFATNVTFSDQVGGGAPFNHPPAPDGQGYDAAITGYRIAPTGAMDGDSGSGLPSFTVVFRLRIE